MCGGAHDCWSRSLVLELSVLSDDSLSEKATNSLVAAAH